MSQTPEYEVLFYEKPDKTCPVDDFLDDLPLKIRGKFHKWIEQLEIYGPNLPRPYADLLRNKIRELRVKFGSNQYRFLYFFLGKKVIMTHGLIKKTDEVPEAEIELAIKYMNDFTFRLNQGEIEL